MYNVARNNFYENGKNSTIMTPEPVSQFLFDLVKNKIDRNGVIFDPCVGQGSLLKPFVADGFETIGIDIEPQGFPNTIKRNFIAVNKGDYQRPSLVIVNPPFNIDEKTKFLISEKYGGRPLLPEIWLQKIIELWGKELPIILFAPYGLRLNQTVHSKRWRNFSEGTYPEITTIISLPKDIYSNVLFHSEVLMFNIPELKGHYFFDG